MAKGNPNIAEAGKSTRFPHNDPTKGGRKPSIKKQLFEILERDGEMLVDAKDVIEVNDDGSVVIKLPTETQMALKLVKWATSKKGNDSLKAIQMVMDQVDGKPTNHHEINGSLSVVWNETKTYDSK